MNKLGVFIKDTFIKNVKSVSFITMLLSPIILLAIIAGIVYFATQSDSEAPEVEIAVISEDPSIAQMLVESDETLAIADEVTTVEEARDALGNDEISGYLEVNWEDDQLNGSLTHDGLDNHIPIIEQVLTNTQVLVRASELNVTPEQLQSLNEPVVLDTQVCLLYTSDAADDEVQV